MLQSDWYQQRLITRQKRDIKLWKKHVKSLKKFKKLKGHEDLVETMDINGRLERAKARLEKVRQPEYLKKLEGTIGADSLGLK